GEERSARECCRPRAAGNAERKGKSGTDFLRQLGRTCFCSATACTCLLSACQRRTRLSSGAKSPTSARCRAAMYAERRSLCRCKSAAQPPQVNGGRSSATSKVSAKSRPCRPLPLAKG